MDLNDIGIPLVWIGLKRERFGFRPIASRLALGRSQGTKGHGAVSLRRLSVLWLRLVLVHWSGTVNSRVKGVSERLERLC